MPIPVTGGLPASYMSLRGRYATRIGASGRAGRRADVVDIRVPLPAADVTALAGDSLYVRELFSSLTGDLFRVALRGEGGGRLMLRGTDVTERTDFAPMDFDELEFVAGPGGSALDILVVARAHDAAGSPMDGRVVRIAAASTGERSVNALAALRTGGATPAGFATVMREAAIYAAAAAPRVAAALAAARPLLSARERAGAVSAYRAQASVASAADTLDLTDLFALLGGGAAGGVRTAGTDLSRLTSLALHASA